MSDSLYPTDETEDTMDIRSVPGDRVMFKFPMAGYEPDQRNAEKYLRIGGIYTISRINVHSCSTDVYLIGFPNVAFNSVMFADL